MAQSLWVKTIRKNRMDKSITEPTTREDPMDALTEACHRLDVARPLWLEKNQREWDNFGQTRFFPDSFSESVDFDRMDIEFIDPDAPKKHSKDPRNQ